MKTEFEKLSQTLENITQRLEKLEYNTDQEILTLIEILANATFFGQMKKALCEHAKDGQCSLYIIDTNPKAEIPFTTICKIRDCNEQSVHSHLEISNITCGLCHENEASLNFFKAKNERTHNRY